MAYAIHPTIIAKPKLIAFFETRLKLLQTQEKLHRT